MLTYAIEAGEIPNDQALVELIKEGLSPEIGEKVMTLAQRWPVEGKREVAVRLLQQGVSIKVISQATDLSPKEIRALKPKKAKVKPDLSS